MLLHAIAVLYFRCSIITQYDYIKIYVYYPSDEDLNYFQDLLLQTVLL